MRRVSCVLVAFAVFVPSLARAQNFPDLPLDHWVNAAWTPRALELTAILADAGLVQRPSLGDSFSHDKFWQRAEVSKELQNHMRLLQVYLAVVPRSDEEHGGAWLAGWQRHLPVVEEVFKEMFGDWYKSVEGKSEMKDAIRVIKERFAERGTPVDEHRFEPFSDLQPGHWANHAIIRMRERGILNGYPDNTFQG